MLSVLAILVDRIHAYGMYPMFGAMNKEGFTACSCGFETTERSFKNDLEYFHSLVRESYGSEQFIAMTHVGNIKLLIEKLEHMHDFSIELPSRNVHFQGLFWCGLARAFPKLQNNNFSHNHLGSDSYH